MKTKYLYIALLSLIIASCKKDGNKTDIDKGATQKVSFKASFTQTTKIIKTTSLADNSVPDTALTNHIQVLYYMVFDSNGNLVHNITQKATDPNFGSYTDNLHAGVYTVATAGGPSTLQIIGGKLNTQLLQNILGDVYFTKDTMRVANTSLNKPMSLNRITSKLSIVIRDVIPVGAKFIWIGLGNLGAAFNVGTGAVTSSTDLTQTNSRLTAFDLVAGQTNYNISTTMLYGAPFSMELFVLDKQYYDPYRFSVVPFGHKILSNISGAKNSVITLTGNMFGGLSGDNGTTVKTDTVWNTPIVKPF